MLTLEQELFTRFGYEAFKPGQKEVITNLLDGMNTLAVLPTGTGISICGPEVRGTNGNCFSFTFVNGRSGASITKTRN